jgi:hypothetical protein
MGVASFVIGAALKVLEKSVIKAAPTATAQNYADAPIN